MATILIIDDEADMRQLISMYLQNSGYTTIEGENGDEAFCHLNSKNIDLILLDIMLPGKDGFAICEEIRRESTVPVIFLTAKGEEWDMVKGLQIGGDDYIVKPFSPGALVARIEAVLRRISGENQKQGVVQHGMIEMDTISRNMSVAGKVIHLTFKEFEMFRLMMQHHGTAFSRESLLDKVWGLDYHGGTRTVDTHIKTIRMKLGKEASSYIQTIWGYGYKFEVPK